VALAEAKKPEHCQYYDNQTNNINESIHDCAYEVVDLARLLRRCCVVCALAHISAQRGESRRKKENARSREAIHARLDRDPARAKNGGI
jgi:hypothetical protein